MDAIREIEQVVQSYADAVHTQDESGFKSVWTQQSENVLISGTKYFRGVDSIYQDFLIGMIRQKYSSIYLVNDGLEAYLLTDDVAVAVFRYHTDCIVREDGSPFGMAGIETQVLKKTENGWKIAHIQYHGKNISTLQS